MNIKCPDCGRDHEVPSSRLPADRFRATCRGCKNQFVVVTEDCRQCGCRCQQGHCFCTKVSAEVTAVEVVHGALSVENKEPVSSRKKVHCHRVHFSGQAGAFFRIWIVNLFLTVVTLGLYTPWAKVRTRAYFYNHTSLAGEPFEYLADPMILLRGYLLIGVGFIIYSCSQIMPVLSGLIMLTFYAVFPLLAFKSLRFYAHNSSFRNIRFAFLGSVSEAYTTYLALPFAIPLTMGLILPYWMYYRKKYFFENFAFGGTRNVFTAKVKPFYWFYFKAALMMLLAIGVVGGLAALLLPQVGKVAGMEGNMGGLMVIVIIAIYAGSLLGFTFVQQYIYAKTMNYCWQESVLGAVKFESTLLPSKLMIIQFTNLLAMLVSAGLLYPWAKVRRTRYILENLTLHVHGDLDEFTAAGGREEVAIGEAAMDFFDFEIGL